jgi:acetylglutamate kinase
MKPVAVKIGGSTLGDADTTIEDLITLQKRNVPLVVIHGGGNAISSWLDKFGIETSFVRGLRVTDLETLKVVTAVLAGLVNKELVSAIWRRGGKAVGISGVDGGLILAKNKRPELGYTGEEVKVNVAVIEILIKAGYMPVIAPVSLGLVEGQDTEINLLNVNADTAAGEIAAALKAEKLIFLTDVPGLYDNNKKLIQTLNPQDAREMIDLGVARGGMAAKLEACLMAMTKVPVTRIIDGRVPHALLDEFEGKGEGTTIGW